MGLTRLQAAREFVTAEPGLLRLTALLLIALAAVVGASAEVALGQFKGIVRTIGKDAAPSVVLAGRIRESLASLDANAVNGFLPGAPKEAYAEVGDRKDQLVQALVEAAGNVTFGESELVPIRALISGLADYMGYAKTANLMGYPGGIPAQLKASQLLHQQLLPAGEELDRANLMPLQASARYVAERDFAAWLKFSGLLLVALLVAVQVLLALRFRRVFNPSLVLALLLTIAVIWRVDAGFVATQVLVKEGVEDAFDSVHAMSKAKALAEDSNGDESLYLLTASDRTAQTYYEDSFKQKITHLLSAPVTARVRDQFSAAIERHAKAPYDGYLADALNNVTFSGEDKLALSAFDSLKRYLEVDAGIRDFERSGQHAKAIELALGNNPGQSNFAFDELARELTALARLNEREFEERMTAAQSRLRADEIFGSTSLGVVAFLCFLGLRPRISEFS